MVLCMSTCVFKIEDLRHQSDMGDGPVRGINYCPNRHEYRDGKWGDVRCPRATDIRTAEIVILTNPTTSLMITHLFLSGLKEETTEREAEINPVPKFIYIIMLVTGETAPKSVTESTMAAASKTAQDKSPKA